jgi:hypothetical protein
MNFDDARFCDMIAYQAVLDDAPRGTNRALIANCANGVPPYSESEVQENAINVNVNDLAMTRALHEGRQTFMNGFLKNGNFFKGRLDGGAVNKRNDRSVTVTQAINKYLKKSIPYFESYRSKIGLLCLHGIAPAAWDNEDKWCPKPRMIGDVLIPTNTLLGFENMPRFILRKSFTDVELQKITMASKRDPGWNMSMVNRCLDWLDTQMTTAVGNNWPTAWSPERVAERAKENARWYVGDMVPTIEVFDCYFWDDRDGHEGWVRRIILDSWGTPSSTGVNFSLTRDATRKSLEPNEESDFLFNSGERKVGQTWQNIISFNFADLSAVAPFRYHSVRSMGFLLYAVCHLQNRLRCKFNEALFENLLMLFRVKSLDDVQRALKLDMVNKGFIDETLTPVPAAERWQVRADLIQMGLNENNQLISASTGAFAQRRDFSNDNVEKTRFQVMAEVNADTALISAALQQAYQYQAFEDAEVFRRFLKKNSTDPDVRAFRAEVLKTVPEKYLIPEAWDIEHERVMGGGNKTQEMTIAQQLLEMRPMFDPQPQRQVLHDVVLAITDDPAKADELVPEVPAPSNSIHDTEGMWGTLMQGTVPTPKPGLNAVEVAGTTIRLMVQKVQMIGQSGGVGTPQDLIGLQAANTYANQFLQILSQDPTQQELAKQMADILGKVNNEIKGLAQRQQEAAQAQQQNGNGQDQELMAKIQAIMMQAQTKSENAKSSHAEKTAQRRISFEQKLKQDAQKNAMQLRQEAIKTRADVAAKDLTTASEIGRNRIKAKTTPAKK